MDVNSGESTQRFEPRTVNVMFHFISESVTITPKDARWVGAWWMGFLVSSVLLLLSSIPFWFLPRSLPQQETEGDIPPSAADTLEGRVQQFNNHNFKLTDIAKGRENPPPDYNYQHSKHVQIILTFYCVHVKKYVCVEVYGIWLYFHLQGFFHR